MSHYFVLDLGLGLAVPEPAPAPALTSVTFFYNSSLLAQLSVPDPGRRLACKVYGTLKGE